MLSLLNESLVNELSLECKNTEGLPVQTKCYLGSLNLSPQCVQLTLSAYMQSLVRTVNKHRQFLSMSVIALLLKYVSQLILNTRKLLLKHVHSFLLPQIMTTTIW